MSVDFCAIPFWEGPVEYRLGNNFRCWLWEGEVEFWRSLASRKEMALPIHTRRTWAVSTSVDFFTYFSTFAQMINFIILCRRRWCKKRSSAARFLRLQWKKWLLSRPATPFIIHWARARDAVLASVFFFFL